MRVANGGNAPCRESGAHNGSTCTLENWELDPVDLDAAADGGDAQIVLREVVLRALPKKLVVRMGKPTQNQYEGLPGSHFPRSPVTVYWPLNAERTIENHRRGFSVVPNFSAAVDASAEKTADAALDDVGAVREKLSSTKP